MMRSRYSLLLLFLFACTTSARAQVVPTARDTTHVRPDTTSADTSSIRTDTAATPAFTDSVKPLPQIPTAFLGPANGFSDGVWVWDRTGIQLETTTTLGDLLERIPGINIFRSGLYAQPLAASFSGATANGVEIWFDGYILDPLLESSFDISKMELAELENVRVERHFGKIRIFIQTLSVKDTRAYSNIEAGVSQPNANVFRGLFMVPKLFFGPVGFALDRIDTHGLAGSEPANQVGGWAKWSYVRPNAGLQVEYHRTQTNRDEGSPWPDQFSRSDIIVQGRARLRPGLVAEVFGGRTHMDLDTSVTRADSVPHYDQDETQFGGRLSYESSLFWANAAAHLRDNKFLPATQFDGAAGIHYAIFSARADVGQSDWRDAGTANELSLQAQVEPFHGLRIFGETTTSDRGAAYLMRLADSTATITSYKGYRAGGELTWHGATVGAALLHASSDSIVSFGLPFDTIDARYPGADVTGFEMSGRVPLPIPLPLLGKGLAAEGMVTNWRSGSFSIYLPTQQYRAGLEYYAVPLKSGNLEMLGRIEMVHRGPMFAPLRTTDDQTGDPVTSITMPAIDYIDAYLQIRIIDVRAFVRYEDLTAQSPFVLPGRPPEVPARQIRGPRIIYGVKWQFFN